MEFASIPKNNTGRYLSVRISHDNMKETLNYIKNIWIKYSNGQAFEYEFFDNHFERIYLAEKNTEYIFFIFSILAIAIACFGLFGLSAFVAERRTKEVGIRKILGSSTQGVVLLLIKQFLKWVAIASIIAWPLAWYIMNTWLADFAYRVEISWSIFLIATVMALLITVITVSSQAIKAAVANPVNALRYE
jgi:putative ABC transport system permease protein